MTVIPLSYGTDVVGRFTETGPTFEWILATLERRRQERSAVMENMRVIRSAYNGDLVIPLPEMNRSERPAVANLMVTGIDQTAQRISSVMPSVDFAPLRPGIEGSREKARTRTMAVNSWWKANRMSQKMRRRARWFVGYSSAPVLIRPHFGMGLPQWQIRDPLSTYPAPTQDPDDITPTDCIFTYFKSAGWLRSQYPVQYQQLLAKAAQSIGGGPPVLSGNTQFELIEYVDAEVTVLGVLGLKQWGRQWQESQGLNNMAFMELERVPNVSAGMCPAVIPQRITLDRPKGQFDDAVGMYEAGARMTALELIAVEKGIFPDTYLVSRQGENAQFIAGPYDGRSGNVNVVKGGDIKEVTSNPGPMTTNAIDRLERAQRISGGLPSEYGGESPTNVRTGRRGDAVMAGIVQFPVQEAQEVFAAALEEENRRAVAVMKHCFGAQKKSFQIHWKGKPTAVDYVPNEVFETDANTVTYAMAGADQNGLTVMVGQLVGMGLMSKESAGGLLPLVADAELEADRVTSEALQAAVLASLQAQAQQGAITPADMGRIAELVYTNEKNLYGAIAQVQREAQERQANAGAPGEATGPVAAGSPEAMPGLAMEGMGQEQPTVAPPPEGMGNVDQLLQMLRAGG